MRILLGIDGELVYKRLLQRSDCARLSRATDQTKTGSAPRSALAFALLSEFRLSTSAFAAFSSGVSSFFFPSGPVDAPASSSSLCCSALFISCPSEMVPMMSTKRSPPKSLCKIQHLKSHPSERVARRKDGLRVNDCARVNYVRKQQEARHRTAILILLRL